MNPKDIPMSPVYGVQDDRSYAEESTASDYPPSHKLQAVSDDFEETEEELDIVSISDTEIDVVSISDAEIGLVSVSGNEMTSNVEVGEEAREASNIDFGREATDVVLNPEHSISEYAHTANIVGRMPYPFTISSLLNTSQEAAAGSVNNDLIAQYGLQVYVGDVPSESFALLTGNFGEPGYRRERPGTQVQIPTNISPDLEQPAQGTSNDTDFTMRTSGVFYVDRSALGTNASETMSVNPNRTTNTLSPVVNQLQQLSVSASVGSCTPVRQPRNLRVLGSIRSSAQAKITYGIYQPGLPPIPIQLVGIANEEKGLRSEADSHQPEDPPSDEEIAGKPFNVSLFRGTAPFVRSHEPYFFVLGSPDSDDSDESPSGRVGTINSDRSVPRYRLRRADFYLDRLDEVGTTHPETPRTAKLDRKLNYIRRKIDFNTEPEE